MIGGDQLWNCKINYFHINHFLPFIQEKERKSVYAASLSQDKMREGFEDTFRELAEGFGYITAREQRAVEIIEELTHREVDRVTDPAFFPFCCGVGTAGKTRSETKQTVFALSIRYNQTEKWFLLPKRLQKAWLRSCLLPISRSKADQV